MLVGTSLADPVVPNMLRRVARREVSVNATESLCRCTVLFEALVGRRTGIVREIVFVPTIDGDAKLFHAAAAIANPMPGLDMEGNWFAGGSGLTRQSAVLAALGEALERHASSLPSDSLEVQTAQQIKGPWIAPERFTAFSAEQRQQPGFPFAEVSTDTPLRWVEANRSGGSRIAVPAFAVYLSYMPALGEPIVTPGLSTGLACSDTLDEARFRAICEVVERDSLVVTWLRGLSPPRIDSPWIHTQSADLLPPRDQVSAFDLTSDVGLPVVLVVCRGLGPYGPVLSVGSACHIDPRLAIRKAALEASQGRVFMRQLVGAHSDWNPLPDFSNVTSFSFHGRLYTVRPDLADAAFAFLDGNPRPSPLPNLPDVLTSNSCERLAIAESRLAHSGHESVWFDLTPLEARAIGTSVVRVLIPSLAPLHGDHRLAALGHPRFSNWQQALPHSVRLHSHDWWPFPHPFP